MARKSLVPPWTPEETDLLLKLLREGKSFVQIARRMKRSESRVRHRAERLGVGTAPGRAGAEGEAMSSDKLVSLSFRTYLSQRAKRYGPGDELITAVTRDDTFAAISSREELDAYLTRCGISRNGQFYANQLWKNYIAAKKRHAGKGPSGT